MGEIPRPDRQTERSEALKAVVALDAIAARQRETKPIPPVTYVDPVQQGAHDSLAIAREVARVTSPYYKLTRERLLLEEGSRGPYERGPYVSVFPGPEGTGEVTILTRKHDLPLTDQRIDKIWNRREDHPKAALLIARLGKSTPGQIINKARRDVSRSLKRSRFALSIFHMLGK